MLTKFPVTTDRGEYRVSIRGSRFWLESYRVNVYVKRSINLPLLRYKKVATHLYDRDDFRDRLVYVARSVVARFERSSDQRYLQFNDDPKAIEAFREWDGDMTTKGQNSENI
ncbi:hypothetical protein [Bacillus sp. Marseille-P3800]|uniref:hypothetical protein n=1 Tax=Bacillus sp. Marseille-P3800 TaxID=2014782 RepID=UPI001145C4E3|nr:hypothetical protein [Bacillus sp. Marseille-P3800]